MHLTQREQERLLILSIMQLVWDRGEADGYAHHMTSDPLPNTPAHTVLLHEAFGVMAEPLFCTKIASRLTRTYTDRHGLKDLVKDVLDMLADGRLNVAPLVSQRPRRRWAG